MGPSDEWKGRLLTALRQQHVSCVRATAPLPGGRYFSVAPQRSNQEKAPQAISACGYPPRQPASGALRNSASRCARERRSVLGHRFPEAERLSGDLARGMGYQPQRDVYPPLVWRAYPPQEGRGAILVTIGGPLTRAGLQSD
jgi:hypothetical protein